MSGTERQSVTNDYEQRISESAIEAQAGVAMSLARIMGLSQEAGVLMAGETVKQAERRLADTFAHCNCDLQGSCLNISICPAATNMAKEDAGFRVVAWNQLSQAASQAIRVPVAIDSNTTSFTVTDLASGQVQSHSFPITTTIHCTRTSCSSTLPHSFCMYICLCIYMFISSPYFFFHTLIRQDTLRVEFWYILT